MFKKVNWITALVLMVLMGCNDTAVYDSFTTLDKNIWLKQNQLTFSYQATDTVTPHHLFLQLRANNEYPFNNLFVIIKTKYPDATIKIDTLEYSMANSDGTLQGEGFSDSKQSKLWFKENFVFSKKGKYTYTIEQANRQTGKREGLDTLCGISDVGLRIEKIK